MRVALGAQVGERDRSRVDPDQHALERLQREKRKAVRRFQRYAGGLLPRHCPICDYYGSFTAFGLPPRPDAHCPKCGSLERHRLFACLFDRQNLVDKECSVLHFAPERAIAMVAQPRVGEYVTADLMAAADLTLNIEDIDLPDNRFDRVICFQVLEHVDDRKALAEMFRILTPGGIAFLNTPVIEGWDATYENPEVDGKHARLIHFGQGDHVRYFGRDIRERIGAAGFTCEEFAAVEPDVHDYGLWRGERIFIARKPGSAGTGKKGKR